MIVVLALLLLAQDYCGAEEGKQGKPEGKNKFINIVFFFLAEFFREIRINFESCFFC